MKFLTRMLLLIGMLGATHSMMIAQTDITVGANNGSNGAASSPSPLPDYFKNNRQQYLYRAADLTAAGLVAGNITKIGWNVTATNAAGLIEGYTISIKSTATTTLTAEEAGLTTVYGPLDYTPVIGLNQFILSSAFTWDGTSNIVIEICGGLTAGAFTNNASCVLTTISGFTGSRWYLSDTGGAPCVQPTTSTSATQRPQVVLTGMAAVCLPPTAAAATLITTTTAQANWSQNVGNFIVEYGPTSTFGTPGTGAAAGNGFNTLVLVTNGNFAALSSLTPATGYSYVIRQDCTGGGNGYSVNSSVITFTTLTPMTYTSSTTTQPVTSTVPAGSVNAQIIRLVIVTSGAGNPLSLTQLNLSTNGSTNAATDITAARVYYTGSSTTFSTATQFGSTFLAPNGAFVVTGSQVLATGNNYFFVAYDIACSATGSNIVDAEVNQVTVGGTPYVPTVQAPAAASRTIVALATYDSVNNGDWSVGSTWACGAPPPNSPTAIININSNITVTDSRIAGSVNIAAGKTLTISGGDLTMGTSSTGAATGNSNRVLTATGTLAITGGTLNVNGNVIISGGFTMSAGTLNIDPNDGTAAGSSTAASLALNIATLNVTGGNINMIDPAYPAATRSIAYSTASADAVFGTGCTITLGGGDDTNVANVGGFYVECNVATGTLEIGTLIVGADCLFSTKRHASTNTSSLFITKVRNLTVNGEIVVNSAVLAITGDVINNGIMSVLPTVVNTGLAFVGDAQYSGSVVLSNGSAAQSLSGSGSFRKSTADAPSSLISALSIFQTATGTGVTLNVPLSVTSQLNLASGKLFTTAGLLTVGESSVLTGTYATAGTGWVVGPIRRWIPTATYPVTDQRSFFPVGDINQRRMMNLFFTAAPVAGTVTAQYNAAPDPGEAGLPMAWGGITVTNSSPTGYWNATSSGVGGTYSVRVDATGFTKRLSGTITDLPNIRLIKRPDAGAWINTDGSAIAPVSLATIEGTGFTTFSDFGVGGTAAAALPLELKSFTGQVQSTTNMLSWETLTEKNVQSHIVERSVDGARWSEVGRKAGQVDSQVSVKYTLEDRAPLAKAYYRLRSVDFDGKESLSSTIVLTRKGDQFGITSVYPSPTNGNVTVQFNATAEETVTVRVMDMTGRLVMQQVTEAVKDINELPLTLTGLQAGVYTVTVANSTGVSAPVRFVKQ